MNFFIPNAGSDDHSNDEVIFEGLAQRFGASAPAHGERVYSVVREEEGEEWTFTVGEELSGKRVANIGGAWRQKRPMSDPAVVQAIYPGESLYLVVTAAPVNTPSAWANPILVNVNTIKKIEVFDPA